MFNLLNSCMHKYLLSVSLKVAVVFSLVSGLICGLFLHKTGLISISDLFSVCPIAISIVTIIVNLCKEHEYGTFRNKVTAGHTKGRIFLSELLVSFLTSAVIYMLFAVGFAAAASKYVFKIRSAVLLRIPILMFISCLGISAMAVMIGSLSKTRTSALIMSLAAIFVMFVAAELIDSFLFQHELETEILSNAGVNPITGEAPVDPFTGVTPEANKYVPKSVINAFKFAYALNPLGALDLYANEIIPYLDGELPSQINLYPRSLPRISLLLLIGLSAVGWAAFRKKDLD